MTGMTSAPAQRIFDYTVLDVFAEHPLEGNPLAVFHDARGMSDAEMQALARETHLAETTFVLPGDPEQEVSQGVRVRIFTTEEELPFAGHPTLGTASWLHRNHPRLRGASAITLRLNAGPITVRFEPSSAGKAGMLAEMRQQDPTFGPTHDRESVARALGLQAVDLATDYPPQTVSTGLPFCIVPLRSLAVAQRLQIGQREAQAWLAQSDAKFFYCVAPLPSLHHAATGKQETGLRSFATTLQAVTSQEQGYEAAKALAASGEHLPSRNAEVNAAATWRARMQFYNGEDPATGSAAGCFVSWLVRHGLAASGQRIVLEQGVEIQRPSRLVISASQQSGRIVSVSVAGRTIPVAAGHFFLP